MRTAYIMLRLTAVVFAVAFAVTTHDGFRAADAAGETLQLDFNISDGACVDIDTTASVNLGGTVQVAVCLADPSSPGIVAAFQYRVLYDDGVVRGTEVADTQPSLDDNPDANAGSTTFTSATYPNALGSGWICDGGVGAFPKGDLDGVADGDGTAYSGGCASTTDPSPGLSQGPLGVVTFNAVGAGTTSLSIAAASVIANDYSQVGSCNPVELAPMTCSGGTISVGQSNATISGKVYANSVAPANVLSGVVVEACTTFCFGTDVTDSTGAYSITGLFAGSYTVTATPPAPFTGTSIGPVALAAGQTLAGQDIVVTAPSGGISGIVRTTMGVVSGANVQACSGSICRTDVTDGSGVYQILHLPAGSYTVTAFPPGNLLQQSIGPVTVSSSVVGGQDILVSPPNTTPPPGLLTPSSGNATQPSVNWNQQLTLTRSGCAGAIATYTITQGSATLRSGSMVEGPAGTYTAVIAPLKPAIGNATVNVFLDCPTGPDNTLNASIYIDPSGFVREVDGTPISGAAVTLFRSDSPYGPFSQVPNGSAIMSFANRANPDTTDANGHFGWDVVAGYYTVRASKSGCVSPVNPSVGFVETEVLTIPPPVTDLDLRLDCSPPPCNPSDPAIPNTDAAPLDNGPLVPSNDVTIPRSDTLNNSCDVDDDNDGALDSNEGTFPMSGCASATSATNPLLMDTDGDHLTDGWECNNGSNPVDALSKALGSGTADADGDRITDLWELRGYTGSGSSTDSDGDGCHDMVEVTSVDGNNSVGDTDRLAVARRALNVWGPEQAQDYALDIDKNGVVGDPDRLTVARAALLPDWLPKSCP